MLDVKANGVRVLGFYGMGGVGKTTLSKALYNKLVIHFKRRSFISNIKETWRHHNGLMDIQNKIIRDLSANEAEHVNEGSQYIIKFKKLIDEEPVLIVLDDVDDVMQLDALAGKRNRFYDGTRIIITTRNKETLVESIVNTTYEVKELKFQESLQLFSYHAFGKEKPAKDFAALSKEIVSLAGGLPLALEVIGGDALLKTLPFEFSSQHIAVLDLSKSKITKSSESWLISHWSYRVQVISDISVNKAFNLFSKYILLSPVSGDIMEVRTGELAPIRTLDALRSVKDQIMGSLLVMNLCDCFHLTKIPDLSDHSFLEKLILENCRKLVKIHKSIGDLKTLRYLNLKNCSNLVEFPSDVSGLKHLENLILFGCTKLKGLSEDMSSMISLKELLIDETVIVKLPDSIFCLRKLEKFSLKNCWSLKRLPDCIGKLSSLKEQSLRN
ncbi:hypothetical protein Q3G72_012782 [Acer saccharum]|nr:hypothetical protein Q3G72_012782 [Acer saccharum]